MCKLMGTFLYNSGSVSLKEHTALSNIAQSAITAQRLSDRFIVCSFYLHMS
jgi:hypothetical protein